MRREAVILAGGLGTRLKKISAGLPKPMLPVAGKPFLYFLLNRLKKSGFNHIVLSVGYSHEKITAYFGQGFMGLKIDYAIEEEPLGTGGAVRLASGLCTSEQFFVFNGDTYFEADINSLEHFHRERSATLSLCLKKMDATDRYGTVSLENDLVVSFAGRGSGQSGLINGGICLMDKALLYERAWPQKFSFEMELLPGLAARGRIHGMVSEGYFIDIGIPEDYEKACRELPTRFSLFPGDRS